MNSGPLIPLPPDDDALLAECEVQTFRSGGKGGQHVNKTDSAVRLIHRPSGLVVVSQSERSQLRNRIDALALLRRKIELANYRKPRRKATREPLRAKIAKIEMKKKRSITKKMRGRVSGED